jgi:ABC-type transport system involved in cytochrome c biogenesis, permease component
LSWAREAGAVFAKEVRSEWRTRVALSSVALFAVGALTLIGLSLYVGQGQTGPQTAAALLWVLVFFTAATGLGRAYVLEEERGTALALRLTARATAVWAGKFAANGLLLLALAALSAPVLLSLLKVNAANLVLLACVLTLGCVGIAAVFTMTSALVAQSSAKGGLLAALSFPVLVPLLVAAVHGTNAALGVGNESGAFAAGAGDVQLLGSYAVVAVTASLMLIDFVWNEG